MIASVWNADTLKIRSRLISLKFALNAGDWIRESDTLSLLCSNNLLCFSLLGKARGPFLNLLSGTLLFGSLLGNGHVVALLGV